MSGQVKRAFTLVEILIIVAILGILAAVVIPKLQDYSQKAKEANAKATLKLLRDAIERYAAQHNGIPPGYISNNTNSTPDGMIFLKQLVTATNSSGATINGEFGPYLTNIPANPFNNRKLVRAIENSQPFPSEPPGGTFGWVYKPETKEIRLNWAGTDSEGQSYYGY